MKAALLAFDSATHNNGEGSSEMMIDAQHHPRTVSIAQVRRFLETLLKGGFVRGDLKGYIYTYIYIYEWVSFIRG